MKRFTRDKKWINELNYNSNSNELFPITIGSDGFPHVSIVINNETFNVLFDTGNMVGLTISGDIAERLELPVINNWTSRDSSGTERGVYRIFKSETVSAFGQTRKNEPIYETWTNHLGLIGPEYLLEKRFTLDYRNCLLAISGSQLPRLMIDCEILHMLTCENCKKGMIVTQGSVNGHEVLIQWDTGKSRTTVDNELVSTLGLPETENGYRIDHINIGSFSFTVPSAKGDTSFCGISKGLSEQIMLGIGSDIISQILFTVDYPGQKLVISQ